MHILVSVLIALLSLAPVHGVAGEPDLNFLRDVSRTDKPLSQDQYTKAYSILKQLAESPWTDDHRAVLEAVIEGREPRLSQRAIEAIVRSRDPEMSDFLVSSALAHAKRVQPCPDRDSARKETPPEAASRDLVLRVLEQIDPDFVSRVSQQHELADLILKWTVGSPCGSPSESSALTALNALFWSAAPIELRRKAVLRAFDSRYMPALPSALALLGPQDVPALRKALHDPDGTLRLAVVEALALLGDDELSPQLERASKSADRAMLGAIERTASLLELANDRERLLRIVNGSERVQHGLGQSWALLRCRLLGFSREQLQAAIDQYFAPLPTEPTPGITKREQVLNNVSRKMNRPHFCKVCRALGYEVAPDHCTAFGIGGSSSPSDLWRFRC